MSPSIDPLDLVHQELLAESVKAGGVGATFGVIAATLQGLWVKAPVKNVITFTGTRAALFSALFQGSAIFSAQKRGRNDSFNYAISGGIVGGLVGFTRSSVRQAAAFAALISIASYGIAEAQLQYLERSNIPLDERNKRPGYFAVPPKDPYTKRLEELKQ